MDLLDQPVVANTPVKSFIPMAAVIALGLFLFKGGIFKKNPRKKRRHARR